MQPEIEVVLEGDVENVGPFFLDLGEDQWFDRKSARIKATDLADALVAFANAEGGTIVIGLHNNVVEGIDAMAGKENEWRQAAIDFTVPTVRVSSRRIECVRADGTPDHLFAIDIPSSDGVHATHRDDVFLRVGDETRRLTFAQRRELEFDKGQSTYETTPVAGSSWGDLDGELVEEWAHGVGHADPKRLLAARGLIARDSQLTVGGVLLLGELPQAAFPSAHVRVLRYRGTARGTGRRQQLLLDQRVEGPLPLQIRMAQTVVAANVPTRRALDEAGRFTEVGAIPRDAWLEGLVNAVTHRSYSQAGDHIRVEIFDDRIEIESPGRFPGIVDLGEPEAATRFARNPRIARVLADFDLVQELGEGIRRIFEEMRLAGLTRPVYHQSAGSVRLTLSTEPVDRALENRLSDSGRDLVRAIRERQRASTGDLAELVSHSRPVVIRDLKVLEEARVIEWVGTNPKDPRAYWRLAR